MKAALVVAVLAVAATLVALLASMGGDGWDAKRAEELAAQRSERQAPADVPSVQATPPRARKRKLVYQDGTPAGRIEVRRAAGRTLLTKIFRNGDYPAKRIWLITRVDFTWTTDDGSFSFSPVTGQAVLYTKADSPAFLLAEFDESVTEYRATRRVKVTGTLRDPEGQILKHYQLAAQKGWPEDYDTRNVREHDSFVGPMGDLEIDPFAKQATDSGNDGRFVLQLLPGRNIVSFGEAREDGTTGIEVPTGTEYDLGDFAVPPKAVVSLVRRALRGTVINMAGREQPHVTVRLWDGNVGQPSHETRTNADGAWRVTGLVSNRVIAWAVSSIYEPHVVLPTQSSGTIQMPCATPVILQVPAEDEYCWTRSPGVGGFFLYIRDGVFLGGDVVSPNAAVGLPPGDYRIVVVSSDGIRETTRTITEGGELELRQFTRN